MHNVLLCEEEVVLIAFLGSEIGILLETYYTIYLCISIID